MNKFDIGQVVYCKQTFSFVIITKKELRLSKEIDERIIYTVQDFTQQEIEELRENEIMSLKEFEQNTSKAIDEIVKTPLQDWGE